MNELALFAGAGGGILAGHMLGWRTVCAVEIEDYPRRVLLQRQADGILPRFPIWDDVATFDGQPWRGKIDIITGGFPCQDISAAGKGVGLDGERSGLWGEMARIIREVRPRYAFIENSPMLTIRGLDRVLCDLAQMGFDANWGVLGADDVGAKHKRDRIWIVAYANDSERRRELRGFRGLQKCIEEWDTHSTFNQPEPVRMVDGVASRVDRLKAVGNGQVPLCATTAWRILNA
jgi:DNA (cytosine-5)-methyltransferase 1